MDVGESGESANATDAQADASTSSESDASAESTVLPGSDGSSSGTGGAGEVHAIASLEADGSLMVTIANHSGPTCADPFAYPAFEDDPCELEEELWNVTLTLAAPFDVPGEWTKMLQGSQLTTSASSISPNPGLPCGYAVGSVPATLAVDTLTDESVEGSVTTPDAGAAPVPFAAVLCP